MKCYACNDQGHPRDIGGTQYYMCDECYGLHVMANKLALAALQAQLILSKSKEAAYYETI